MPFVFKSKDPVEAGFVESFFLERGYPCKLEMIGGLYGLQEYAVIVGGEISPEHEREFVNLTRTRSVSARTEAEEDTSASSSQDFSLLNILLVFGIYIMIVKSGFDFIHYFSRNFFSDVLSSTASALISTLVATFFVYLVARLKAGRNADALLGLNSVKFKEVLNWVTVILIFRVANHIVGQYFPSGYDPHWSTATAAYFILILPICRGISHAGFFLGALQTRMNPILAVILVATIPEIVSWGNAPIRVRIVSAISYMICNFARVRTKSAYTAMAMYSVISLLSVLFQNKFI